MSTSLSLPAPLRLRTARDAAEQAQQLAQDIAGLLREALAARGHASLRLSGGRSPVAFFKLLSLEALDWSCVTIGLVDDRWVVDTHADSNARLLREHLLQNAAAGAKFVPLVNAAATPEQGLDEARVLQRRELPECDVLVLGLGEDGHTASLFPDAVETPAAMRADNTAFVAAVRPTRAPHARISLTLPAVLAARQLLLPIQGAAKRAVLQRALSAPPSELPVAAVLYGGTPLTVYDCD